MPLQARCDPPHFAVVMTQTTCSSVVDRFNAACERRNIAEVFACLADDVAFESTDPAPDGRRAVGKAAVRAIFEPIVCDPAVSFEIEETVVAEAAGCVTQRSVYRWDGGHVRAIDLFRVSDGLIVEILSYVKG